MAQEPTSLSDIVQAAQATAATPEPAATTAPEPIEQTTAEPVEPEEGEAAEPAATESGDAPPPPPPSIDWGSAMPALAAKAKELLGEEAVGVFNKYNDIDGLIKAIAERERQVGQQSVYVGAFKQLADAGVTTEDLQQLMAAKQGRGQSPVAQQPQQPMGWSKKFLAGRTEKGEPIFNKAELARAGINEQQAAQMLVAWQDQLADIFSGPEGIQGLIAAVADPRMGYVAEQTKQELAAQQQAQRLADADAAAAQAWCQLHAKELYVNGRDVSGGVTPLFHQVGDFRGKLDPNMPTAQQLEEALTHVLAVHRPAPVAPTPSPKAGRQPAVAATPVKLDPVAFHEKYGDRYDGLGMAQYMEYVTSGKVPPKRGAA